MNTTSYRRGRGLLPRAAALMALLTPMAQLQPLSPAAAATMPHKHITTNAGLSFGSFVPASGGTITVSPAGVRTRTGAVILLMSSPGAARYSIGANNSGTDNRAYILTLPANGSVFLDSGNNRMPVINFTASGAGGSVLPADTRSLSVGATLEVGRNQPRGRYTGVFPVTIEYQ